MPVQRSTTKTSQTKATHKAWKACGAQSGCVYTRSEFLVQRLYATSNEGLQSEPHISYNLRTEVYEVCTDAQESVHADLPTPPGLEVCSPQSSHEVCEQKSGAEQLPLPEQVAELVPEPKQYKVLLKNLPAEMMEEGKLRMALEAANIPDIIDMTLRQDKALITLSSYSLAQSIIKYFQGQLFGSSAAPVSALYVYTTQRPDPTITKPVASAESKSRPVTVPVAVLAAPSPKQYKVLLENLPDPMLKESLLRLYLHQAEFSDVMDISVRDSGKALLTFASYASVVSCVEYFSGWQWTSSHDPVAARYVQTVKGAETTTANGTLPSKPMCAEAPVFVPDSRLSASHVFSPDAPAFLPAPNVATERKESSSSSTGAGATSDTTSFGCESELDAGVDCTP